MIGPPLHLVMTREQSVPNGWDLHRMESLSQGSEHMVVVGGKP